MARPAAALLLAAAIFVSAATARAQIGPLDDPAAERIRTSFKVDGIALFDAHALHAKRMGVCAPSVFAGLKWCVSGTIDEKRDDVVYAKTTGYNIDADERIVYAISTRRGYPLKREAFEGIVRAIGERYGAGPTLLAFKKPAGEGGGIDSLIAVWGGLRLVQLAEAEYAQVESGQSLKRGHLVDHRFSLVVSAKQRDPIYKIEGEAGFILQLMATSPDRADVIARVVFPSVFLPPPGKPGPEAADPLVGETVRRAPRATSSAPGREPAPAADDRGRRVDAERGLAAERLLREEAERKAAEEKAARAELQRLTAAERRAAASEKQRIEAARKAAEDRAARAEAALKAEAERRSVDEAQRRRADAPAAQADDKRADDRRTGDERKAAEERRRKQDAESKAAEDAARRAAETQRADAGRKADEESRVVERKIAAAPAAPEPAAPAAPARAAPPDSGQRAVPNAAPPQAAVWMLSETSVRGADERTLRAQAFFGATGEGQGSRLALEVTFECTIVGRAGRLRAHARGFDRETGAGVAFRTGGEDSFGVRTRFALDGGEPQRGLLFREHQDDIASFLELPISAAERERDAPRAAIWLRHASVSIDFPLTTGTVSATIAPKSGNLRRVLEACAQ